MRPGNGGSSSGSRPARRIDTALAALDDEQLAARLEGQALTPGDRTRQQCFELWMHTDDVRRATGRPFLDPDPQRTCALSDLSARYLGLGMLVTGQDHPGLLGRLVLTGPGGGTWLTPLAVGAAEESTEAVTVIADAIDYCRMAGRLLRIDELDIEVEGDPALALGLLTGAQAFAV